MFDIGWSEMAVIALLALIVIGPKDLPQVLRTIGKWVRKARMVTREFQSGVDEMIREAELEDAKRAIDNTSKFNVQNAFEEAVDPTGSVGEEIREVGEKARETVTAREKDGAGQAAEAATKPASGDAEATTGATVVEHPVQIAPAHSLTPPEEPTSPTEDAPAAGKSETSQKSA